MVGNTAGGGGGGGGGCKVLGFRLVCGRAGDGAGVLCGMSMGKQGSSHIVDSSGSTLHSPPVLLDSDRTGWSPS